MAQSRSVFSPAALSGPVGHFMRQTIVCDVDDSIERAVGELRRNGGGVLPLVADGILAGVLTETALAAALGEDTNPLDACSSVMTEGFSIAPYASGAEALRLLSEMDIPTLVVIDDLGRVMGLLSPSDLYPRRRMPPRPATVGGMATPFGVYLTSGGLKGGVSLYAVMGTGSVMFTMLLVAALVSNFALSPLDKTPLTDVEKLAANQVFSVVLFLAMMRFAPLAGTHGAEHMVVHAIERGEELTPEVVSRMPRVHPRCGTNLAVALSLFSAIAFYPWIDNQQLRLFVAAIATFYLWRPFGSFAQQYITTKQPNEAQLRSGIKAGKELLERYSMARFSVASVPVRVWNSGLLHVIAGSTLTYMAVKGIATLFHLTWLDL